MDREHTDQFELLLVARDQGAPRQSTEMQMQIVVADVNDNRPTFERRLYEAEVDENAADVWVVTLRADDDDISEYLNFPNPPPGALAQHVLPSRIQFILTCAFLT